MGRGGLIGNLYRPLNQRQIETIHQKSLDVIEHIGLTFETGIDDMLDMVEEAGCRVDRKKARIYFPRKLIEEMKDAVELASILEKNFMYFYREIISLARKNSVWNGRMSTV